MATKFIFVTGGVVSGLGKGITAAVLGGLLKARGLTVRNQKFDPYINVDPSLMSPIQHGEIFVTEDGAETDLDIGHYERFTDVSLNVESDITSGMLYRDVIKREREGGYNGGTVQVVPHIINEIKNHVFSVARNGNPDIVIAEIGGTVGDMESQPFIEAIRQVSYQVGRENCLFIHVTLLPWLRKSKELKTKPTQHSVQKLLSFGIQPDILVCRTEVPMDEALRRKIALYCNVATECVIENIDKDSVYELPLYFEDQGLSKQVCKQLGIAQFVAPSLLEWEVILDKVQNSRKHLRIALTGKYIVLPDAYYSVLEAIEHASIAREVKTEIIFVDAEEIEEKSEAELSAIYADCDAILLPGGFGPRGMEGIITAASFARRHAIPVLGIGLGMQMLTVEFARNVLGLKEAHSDECEHDCSDIFYYAGLSSEQMAHLDKIPFPEQPMRRGAWPMNIQENSLLAKIYGAKTASERHHHRRELNPAWQVPLLQGGLVFSGTSPDGQVIEAVEYPKHPFYLGLIAHPEFKSRPTKAHPVFRAFIDAALQYKQLKARQD